MRATGTLLGHEIGAICPSARARSRATLLFVLLVTMGCWPMVHSPPSRVVWRPVAPTRARSRLTTRLSVGAARAASSPASAAWTRSPPAGITTARSRPTTRRSAGATTATDRRRSPLASAPSRRSPLALPHVRGQDRRHPGLLGRRRRGADTLPAGIGTVTQISAGTTTPARSRPTAPRSAGATTATGRARSRRASAPSRRSPRRRRAHVRDQDRRHPDLLGRRRLRRGHDPRRHRHGHPDRRRRMAHVRDQDRRHAGLLGT